MKLRLFALVLPACFAFLGAIAQPKPRSVTPLSGEFVFGSETVILAAKKPMVELSEYLSEYLGCPVEYKTAGKSNIVLLFGEFPNIDQEGYQLKITPEHIVISSNNYGGMFNGIQQLFRLLPPDVYTRKGIQPGTRLPAMQISDAPRFSYRGMMLDVARTWMDAEAVKRFIDLLSYHSINKLHLHLSDDEGWRIEIRSHPELTQIGGFRGGDSPIRPVYGKWDEKYGGYYTQSQMREMIAYAAARNIEIIPEIDLPGHSRNIGSVHPEIRCAFPPDTVSANGYDYRSAWCVAREENYTLLADILGEICELFPSRYIHIGGDEVDMTQWESCPDCRALMQERGLTDARQLEDLFMERVTRILTAHHKLPGVWNEAAATGAFTRNSLVYGWKNTAACLDATAKEYRTVVMPGSSFYFDMRQSPEEEGHDWAAVFDAKKTFEFDFAANGFSEEQLSHVVGVQGAFWSEAYVSHNPEKPDYLDYMCFPRICALSHLAWNGNDETWESYYSELVAKHYDRMAAMGIRFRLSPPKLTCRDGLFSATVDDGSTIYFLREGSSEEHRYLHPFRAEKPYRYQFFSRYMTARSPYVADKSYYRTITPAVAVSSSMDENAQFPLTNASLYKGISRTARACRQGDWILYTFNVPVRCREMFLQTGNRQLPKTIFTTGYAEVSYDGRTFERVGDLEMGSIRFHPMRSVKAVRLVSTCDDNGTPMVTIQPPVVKPVL